MKDSIALGVISGLIGNTAKDISNYLIWRAGKTELLYSHLAASSFVEPAKTLEPKNMALGQILDMAGGALMGIPVVYLLKLTGKDYHLLKGGGVGLLLWAVLYNLGPTTIKPQKTMTHLSAFVNNLIYGLVTARAAVALADPDVFAKQPVSETAGGRRDAQAAGQGVPTKEEFLVTSPG
jgi:hypothetical protein